MRDRSLSISPSMSRWTERSFLTVASSSPFRLDNDFPSACTHPPTAAVEMMLSAMREEGSFAILCNRQSLRFSPAEIRRGPHAPAGVLL